MKKMLIRKFILWVAPFAAATLLFVVFIGGLCAAFTGHQTQSSDTTTGTSSGGYISLPGNVDGLPVSNNLLNFIESWEGFSAVGYSGEDSWNVTIGYGHVEAPGENIGPLTQQQAQKLLISDLQNGGYVTSVQKTFAGVNLTQYQIDALVSMAYNLGPNIWKSLNLTKDIKAGASNDVLEKDFERVCNVGGQPSAGLLRRRKAEWIMYSQGKYLQN